ncbi:MAG: glycosyltransferase family 4 protein [Rugosibacter sp.]|nr:glycosyltransferase family 4 protein [Rugosibacter sp.]
MPITSSAASNRFLDGSIVYFHRLQFPSESGQTIQVLRDYHSLANLGYSVHLIYTGPHPMAPEKETTALREYGLEPLPTMHLHYLAEGRNGKKRLAKTVARICAAIEKGSVFLVARTLDHARSALALRRQIRQSRLKVILELHETAIPHLIYREQKRPLRALLSQFLEKNTFRAIDGIVCTVASQLAILDSLYPDHAPAAVLPNGAPSQLLNLPLAQRETTSISVSLGYAGQLNAWKNVGVMIESLKYLPPWVMLYMAGGKRGDEVHTRITLTEIAEKAGVGGRVNYVGFLPPVEVPEFIARMDILLLPLGDNAQSRFFTSPMKLFEYAASGVPMVVTRQPTTESLIEDGVQALMVLPGSAPSMGKAVNTLLANTELSRNLATNARKWVEQYTYPKRAARLAAFLDSIAKT